MAAVRSYVDVFLSPSTQYYLSNHTMVGRWFHTAAAVFWRADFWLPDGLDWADLEGSEDMPMPNFYDVWVYPLLLGVFLLLLQSFFIQPYLLEPLANAAGIYNKRPRPPPPCPTLEVLYSHRGIKPSDSEMKEAAGSNGMTRRQVERWLRRRNKAAHSTLFEKFVDCGFNLICHIILAVYGWWTILLAKPWVTDMAQCWIEYPFHPLDNDVWWYYILGLSYFWAGTFIQIHAPGRSTSDKAQMIMHHLFTILLMVFSWTCNFMRVGTLVLLIHDVADIPLLSGKIFVYTGSKVAQDICFGMFIICWVITRCYLYPFWFMRRVITELVPLHDTPAMSLFVMLLLGLLVINVVWTILIVGVIYKKVKEGSLQDVRSDMEDLVTEDEDEDEVTPALHTKTKEE